MKVAEVETNEQRKVTIDVPESEPGGTPETEDDEICLPMPKRLDIRQSRLDYLLSHPHST